MLKAILFFTLVALVGSQGTCDNPFFTNVIGQPRWWADAIYSTEPVVVPVSAVCPNFDDGEAQCCTQEFYDRVEAAAWPIAREIIEETVEAIRKSVELLRELRKEAEKLHDEIDRQVQDQEEREKLHRLVDAVVEAYSKFIKNAVKNWANCAGVILEYWAGLICFGCDTNWEDYITITLTGPRIILNRDTCDNFLDRCLPFFQMFIDLINDVIDAVSDYGGANLPLLKNFCELINPTDADCRDYICNVLVDGKGYTTTDVTSLDSKREANQIAGVLHERLTQRVPESRAFVEGISHLHESLVHLVEKVQNARGVAGTSHEYSDSSGVHAVKMGEDSSLDTHVSGASSITSWVNYLF